MNRTVLVALLVLTPPLLAAEPMPVRWTPALQLQVNTVEAVRVSPDGKRVVYVVTQPVMTDERSELVQQIYLASTDGSESFPITLHDKSSSDPQWSPDGQWILFKSKRAERANLYLLPLRGGEAEPLTDLKGEIGEAAFSPDGAWIAFTMSDPAPEDEEKKKKAKDDAKWVEEDLKAHRLYIVPVVKDAAGKREPVKLAEGDFTVGVSGNPSNLDWLPDGSAIVFAHARTPGADYWPTADISRVDVATKKIIRLAATAAAETQPHVSPDGKWIAIVASDEPPSWGGSSLIRLITPNGERVKDLIATWDAQPDIIDWSPDGKLLFVTETRGTVDRIYAIDVAANSLREVNQTEEAITAVSLNARGTHFGMARQTTIEAPEAWVSAARRYAPVKVSRANTSLPNLPLGKSEVVRWKSPDGMEIEGLLTYPAGYKRGERVPMLLVIHGGPAGVFRQTFIGNHGVYPIASFAAKGYAVLRANPRGSSGYGLKFRRANYNDWGGGDFGDLMAGVDKIIAMGVADPDRLGVMGWSYGGFMTSWIIGHSDRFKAASSGAPVTNLISFNGTADIPSFLPDFFLGEYWDNFDTYRQHSPVLTLGKVTTPTLIVHGDADIRVPISQGYELYNALKRRGVPTRMLVLPRQPHGPNEPRMRLRAMEANLEWFEKYLK